jgi:hypothetical protein
MYLSHCSKNNPFGFEQILQWMAWMSIEKMMQCTILSALFFGENLLIAIYLV